MKPEKPKFLDIFRENPFLILWVLALVAIIGIVILVARGSTPKTDGDRAATDSRAFLVYKDIAYFPTKNVVSDTLVRSDIAFFARQTMKVYDPKKNPAVVFNLSKISNETDNSKPIVLAGKFEKSKDDISITITRLVNDRVKVSIINNKSKTNIDDKLPSASKENVFIQSLPIRTDNYLIEYLSYDGSITITIGEKNETYFDQANKLIQEKIGKADMSGLNIAYNYPTGADFDDELIPID